MTAPVTATVETCIDATPEQVYALISDVTRMGEWSPECVTCTWTSAAHGVGGRFRGRNRSGLARWTTTAEVVIADPGLEFAFTTLHKGREATRWRYQLSAEQHGTHVRETYEAVYVPALIRLVERLVIRDRAEQVEHGMQTTLDRLKATAENTLDASGSATA